MAKFAVKADTRFIAFRFITKATLVQTKAKSAIQSISAYLESINLGSIVSGMMLNDFTGNTSSICT